jgi:hypothetical protein
MTNPQSARVAPATLRGKIHVTLEYLGFRNARERREYILRVQSGEDTRDYTVWIAHSAFARRQALLQDGPDICYQKLQRALAACELPGVASVAVTESDLASYRAAHAPPARRPPPPRPVAGRG